MDGAAMLVAFAAAVLVLGFLFLRRREPVSDAGLSAPTAPEAHLHPYHCVTIRPGPGCCALAPRLEGVRFLSLEAPSLPLPGCPSAHCTCAYEHHEDRRHEIRRNPYRLVAGALHEPAMVERRGERGRRSSDHELQLEL